MKMHGLTNPKPSICWCSCCPRFVHPWITCIRSPSCNTCQYDYGPGDAVAARSLMTYILLFAATTCTS